ncbi:MAG: WG repeat-containing protein [Clostridia bacterium]|nr:WG repeat-containing protein [Clostridia bacterium]
MKDSLLKGYAFLILLTVMLGGMAQAEERQVWAPQGDVAFFTENGKVGLQTVRGEVLHEAFFDKASHFDEMDQACVFIDGKIGWMDRAGNIVVEPLECDSMWRLGTGPEQVLVFQIRKPNVPAYMAEKGFFSIKGEMLSDAKWHNINAFRNGFTFARVDNKIYKIDMQGNILKDEGWERLSGDIYSVFGSYGDTATERTILDPNGEEIATFGVFPEENGSGIYTLGAKIYLNGQVYIRDDWTHFKWLSENRYAFEQSDGKWGIVDLEMNEISPPRWDRVYYNPTPASFWNAWNNEHTPEGIWLVYEDWKYGWMDETGKMLLEPTYDNIAPVGENLWLASTYDDETFRDHYILNEKGQIVSTIPGSVGGVSSYGEGSISYTNYETRDWGFVNMEGEILSAISGVVNIYNGFDLNNSGLVSDGRILISRAGWYGRELGFADVHGNTISSREWKDMSDFSHGFAVVETEDGFRYINHEGLYVNATIWDYAAEYFFTGSQWIAKVGKLNATGAMQYGYIDEQGERICEINLTESQLNQ